MPKTIYKKIHPEPFRAIWMSRKTFVLCKDEDNAQPGDMLILQGHDGQRYTGGYVRYYITYVLRDVPEQGLQSGYCIMGIQVRWDRPGSGGEGKEPVKKIPIKYGQGIALMCPRCGSAEYLHNEDGRQNDYCGQCGTRLDWERLENTDTGEIVDRCGTACLCGRCDNPDCVWHGCKGCAGKTSDAGCFSAACTSYISLTLV